MGAVLFFKRFFIGASFCIRKGLPLVRVQKIIIKSQNIILIFIKFMILYIGIIIMAIKKPLGEN